MHVSVEVLNLQNYNTSMNESHLNYRVNTFGRRRVAGAAAMPEAWLAQGNSVYW